MTDWFEVYPHHGRPFVAELKARTLDGIEPAMLWLLDLDGRVHEVREDAVLVREIAQ